MILIFDIACFNRQILSRARFEFYLLSLVRIYLDHTTSILPVARARDC